MRPRGIRGAGTLLGGEQSGHVAAIGFELYVSMLDEAVALLAGTSGVKRITKFDATGYAAQIAAEVACRAETRRYTVMAKLLRVLAEQGGEGGAGDSGGNGGDIGRQTGRRQRRNAWHQGVLSRSGGNRWRSYLLGSPTRPCGRKISSTMMPTPIRPSRSAES